MGLERKEESQGREEAAWTQCDSQSKGVKGFQGDSAWVRGGARLGGNRAGHVFGGKMDCL